MSVRRHASPSVPQVSSATKRSFQKAADDGRHYTDKISASPRCVCLLLQSFFVSRKISGFSLVMYSVFAFFLFLSGVAVDLVCGGGGVFLACEDLGRTFNHSFPACIFFFFF